MRVYKCSLALPTQMMSYPWDVCILLNMNMWKYLRQGAAALHWHSCGYIWDLLLKKNRILSCLPYTWLTHTLGKARGPLCKQTNMHMQNTNRRHAWKKSAVCQMMHNYQKAGVALTQGPMKCLADEIFSDLHCHISSCIVVLHPEERTPSFCFQMLLFL